MNDGMERWRDGMDGWMAKLVKSLGHRLHNYVVGSTVPYYLPHVYT